MLIRYEDISYLKVDPMDNYYFPIVIHSSSTTSMELMATRDKALKL